VFSSDATMDPFRAPGDYSTVRRAAVGVVALLGGCMPPPMNVGYVTMDASHRGGVDVQGQAGGGSWVPGPTGGGGAAMHVEPFVADDVSLPVGVGVGGSLAGAHLPMRVGLRHRVRPFFAWGAGLGPSFIFDRTFGVQAGVIDLELIFGVQRSRVGFSFGVRPALSFTGVDLTAFVLGDPTLAIRLVGDTSLTLAIPCGGMIFEGGDGTGFMGAAIGVHRRFGVARGRAERRKKQTGSNSGRATLRGSTPSSSRPDGLTITAPR
jgi:hypothetical protein